MNTDYSNRRSRFARRLTTRLLINISLWSLLLVVALSTVSFWISYQQAKADHIQSLTEQAERRIERESRLFRTIEDRAAQLAATFERRYAALADKPAYIEKFDRWYVETEPGTLRLKEEFFEGTTADGQWFESVSTFVGPGPRPLSDEIKARTIIAQYLVNEFGPALHGLVTNTHISLPENILTIYQQDNPWGLLAAPELVITDFSTVGSTLQENNPERNPVWTGLYFDLSAGYWTITYQVPLDIDGQHMMNASHDVAMTKLIAGLVEPEIPSAQSMVFNNSGQLIAAEETLSELHQQQGMLTPDKLDNPIYQEIYQIVEASSAEDYPQIFRNALPGQLMLLNKIDGPGWWHVTIYPYREIQRAALAAPLALSGVSIGLVLLILAVVYILINRQVSRPLNQLSEMAELVGDKRYEEVLAGDVMKQDARSEVGLLVRSFKTMAKRQLEHQLELEAQVKQRTRQLAQANEKLDRMAHLDGLTGLLNRRAFDRDLAEAITKAESNTTALVLGDLDGFKAFNDNFGHQAGDEALQAIALCMQKKCNGRVYRYGGEELAILLPALDLKDAKDRAEQLRQHVESLAIQHEDNQPGVLTISFGVTIVESETSPGEQIDRADKNLYLAKASGRNTTR